MADHPLHAEAVGADAELLGPFDLLQRHLDAAAVRQAGEHAVGLIGAVGFHRDVGVGADLEVAWPVDVGGHPQGSSEEHTYEHQSLMRRSYAVFCFEKKK